MEKQLTDNELENHLFSVILGKSIVQNGIKEVYEVVTKSKDSLEDEVDTRQLYRSNLPLWKGLALRFGILNTQSEVEGLEETEELMICKFLFGTNFRSIETLDVRIQEICANIATFRTQTTLEKGIIFTLIFQIIENIFNLDDKHAFCFMLSDKKETVEIELSYLIEKALFAFEGDAREKLSNTFRETSNKNNSFDEIYVNFTELMNKMVVHFSKSSLIEGEMERFMLLQERMLKISPSFGKA